MILDAVLILIFIISIIVGRKTGVFLIVARFCSLLIAALCTSFLKEPILSVIRTTDFYISATEKLVEAINNAVLSGKTALIAPFLEGAASGLGSAAKSILDMIFTALIFIVISLLVRLIIRVLNKFILKLPVIGHLNHFLGMVFSLAFTVVISYLVIGMLGGLAMCSDAGFIKEQMEASFLVRNMYENNIILNIF